MTEQGLRFRIGVFVLASLLLLAVLITLFGSLPGLFKRTVPYSVRFQDATGVAVGTPVRRSGVKIGEVYSLELEDETGEVLVHLRVDTDHGVRRDEAPVLMQGILGGDATIDFVRQQPEGAEPLDRGALEPGTVLTGVRQAGVSTLVAQAAQVVPTTRETLNEIRKSLQRFERMAPLMEETIREYRDLARATREVVPELRRTNQEVQELARAARLTVPELRKTNEEVQLLARAVRETVPELRKTNEEILITARNWGRLGERLDVLLQENREKLIKTIDNFNDMLVRISTTFSEANQRNLAATLENVRRGSESLESVAEQADEFVREGRVVLKRVNESVARTDEVLANLQQATRPMAERMASVMKSLDEGSARLNLLLADVREVVRAIGQGDGTLRRFLADPSLYNNLNEAACQVTRILPRLDRVLKDVEVFADKIARHPEALGLGGIVNPSAGLKGPPTPTPLFPVHSPGH